MLDAHLASARTIAPAIRPFDGDDVAGRNELVQPELGDFDGFEAIEIDVLQNATRPRVLLDQREGRAGHVGWCDAEAAGQAAHEGGRSEEHTSELQSLAYLVCRLLLEK